MRQKHAGVYLTSLTVSRGLAHPSLPSALSSILLLSAVSLNKWSFLYVFQLIVKKKKIGYNLFHIRHTSRLPQYCYIRVIYFWILSTRLIFSISILNIEKTCICYFPFSEIKRNQWAHRERINLSEWTHDFLISISFWRVFWFIWLVKMIPRLINGEFSLSVSLNCSPIMDLSVEEWTYQPCVEVPLNLWTCCIVRLVHLAILSYLGGE